MHLHPFCASVAVVLEFASRQPRRHHTLLINEFPSLQLFHLLADGHDLDLRLLVFGSFDVPKVVLSILEVVIDGILLRFILE